MSEQKTVLCIDDDSFTLAHLKDALSGHYKLLFAIDPDVGFELAVKKQPDLILLDLNMPNMSGFELADLTSHLGLTKEIPFIFMSAFASDEIVDKANKMGAAGFMKKPVDNELLISTIDSVLTK